MVTSILISWLGASLGLWIAGQALRGVRLTSFGDALWAGLLLGVLNHFLHSLLFFLVGVLTLGIAWLLGFITTWFVSAAIILLTAKLSSRLDVKGWFSALITAFLVAGATSLVRLVVR